MNRRSTCLFAILVLLVVVTSGRQVNQGIERREITLTNTTSNTTQNATTNTTNGTTHSNSTTNATNTTTNHTSNQTGTTNTTNNHTNGTNGTTTNNSTNNHTQNTTNSTNSSSQSNTTNATSPPVNATWFNFNRTCFGCVYAGYKYCHDSQVCIRVTDNCTINATQQVYTNSTGCPISTQCQFGINGLVFVSSTGPNMSVALNSSYIDNAANNTAVVYSSGTQQMIVPADKPCVIGFVNYQKQNLSVSFTNQNVSAYLFTLSYPNSTMLTPVQQSSNIVVMNNQDMAYLYIGSINNQSAQTLVSWQKYVAPVTPSGPVQSASALAAQIIALVSFITMIAI